MLPELNVYALAHGIYQRHYAVVEGHRRGARSGIQAWAIVLPILLGVGLLVLGFGLGSVCTDLRGNGGLNESPCNRVDIGVKVNLGLQAIICVVAVIFASRWKATWIGWAIIVLSIAVFVGSYAIATSY